MIKYLISQRAMWETKVLTKEKGLSAVSDECWKGTNVFKIDCKYFPSYHELWEEKCKVTCIEHWTDLLQKKKKNLKFKTLTKQLLL